MKQSPLTITLAMLIGGIIMLACSNSSDASGRDGKRHVLLLGASVGYGWDVPHLTDRIEAPGYVFEMVPHYRCDKSPALDEILMRPKRKFKLTKTYFLGFFRAAPQKPDLLIIKECAAYFPRDIKETSGQVIQWLSRIKAAGIEPGLATIVPVTEAHAKGKPGRLESIWAYNDWVRTYAAENHLKLLDLEKALRISETNRSLRPEFTSGDGLHLNGDAYKILDRIVLPSL